MYFNDPQLPRSEARPEPDEPIEAELVEEAEPPLTLRRPTAPHPNFWWSLLWCFGYLMVTQVGGAIVGAFIGIFILMVRLTPRGFLQVTKTEEGAHVLMRELVRDGILCSQVFSIAMGLIVLRLVVGRNWARQIALRAPAPGHVLLALLGLPALIVLGNGVQTLASHFLPGFTSFGLPDAEQAIRDLKTEPLFLLILAIGVGPGLGEELWCRGFLGRGLVGNYGIVGGVLLTSFLFGAIHLDPPQAVMAMVMGIFLHLSYLATRSLWVPILLHFLNNSMGVLDLTDQCPPLKALENIQTWQMVVLLYGSALLLLAAVGWALYLSRARVVSSGEGAAWQPPHPGVTPPVPGSGASVVWAWPGWAAAGMVGLALMGFITVTFQLVT